MIIGLTDKAPAFPEIGTLRKGAAKPENGNKPGADLKHFRFDSHDQDAARLFKEIYGEEPRAIRVFVPYTTTDENFDAWREAWTASSLQHRCDGKTMVRWLTPRGTYSDEPKPCAGGCKQVGRLKLIIPELRRLAYVTALTTSIHDILQIHANLKALEGVRGDLRGIPLILRRAPRAISTPGGKDGGRARREKWLITLEAQQQWVELQLTAQQQAALPQAQPLALPEWDGEEDEIEEAAPVQAPALMISEESIHYPQRSQPVAAPAAEPVGLGTLHAIEKLWPRVGATLKGEKVSLRVWLSATKQISEPTEMPQELAVKLLGWLQDKALKLSESAEQPKADHGAGLDQWRCTKETQSRQLAMDTLGLTRRLEATGVTEEEWRSELNAIFHNYPQPVSRKSLTAEELRETWLPLVEGWAKRNEAKAKGASQ